jgi:hypothetical protein
VGTIGGRRAGVHVTLLALTSPCALRRLRTGRVLGDRGGVDVPRGSAAREAGEGSGGPKTALFSGRRGGRGGRGNGADGRARATAHPAGPTARRSHAGSAQTHRLHGSLFYTILIRRRLPAKHISSHWDHWRRGARPPRRALFHARFCSDASRSCSSMSLGSNVSGPIGTRASAQATHVASHG